MRRRVPGVRFSDEPCSVWRVPLKPDRTKPACRRYCSTCSLVSASVYEWLSAIELSSQPATSQIRQLSPVPFIAAVGTTDPHFATAYLEGSARHLPGPPRTSCLAAFNIMSATKNPDGIESTAINITSQEYMTPLTLCNVNGSSSFTSIEGEPFSPAELAAIFALSKAQATTQAEISANHPGDVISCAIASVSTVSQSIWLPSHPRTPRLELYTGYRGGHKRRRG